MVEDTFFTSKQHLYALFGTTLITIICLYFSKTQDKAEERAVNTEFRKFQRDYVLVFLLAMGADWVHGPYIYKLYLDYGFSQHQIAVLFIAGFGSAAVMGLFVGALTDKFGRKRACITYGIIYGISCLTKHVHNFAFLFVGRICGGIATAILFSGFESWMVAEHNKKKFEPSLLGSTFGWAWGWNYPVAVLCGVVANIVVQFGGSVAAFDAQLVILIIMVICINYTWEENHGSGALSDVLSTISAGLLELKSNRNIILICCAQTLFESAMYIFVFLWTPVLGENQEIHHGWIFSVMLMFCMVGSEILQITRKNISLENIGVCTFAVASVLFFVLTVTEVYIGKLLLFCFYEMCCGIYFPLLSSLRSTYISDDLRATLTALCRIPLNIIVIGILMNTETIPVKTIFRIASVLNVLSAFAVYKIDTSKSVTKTATNNNTEEENTNADIESTSFLQ